MALLGLGFSFGGKDAGLGGVLTDISDGFKKVGKSALGLTGIQKTLDGISFAKLDEFKSKLGTLGGQKIGSGALKLTTSLEAQMQQMDASVRKYGMNLGITGKKLAVFSARSRRLAYSLNISEEAAAGAVQALDYLRESPALGAAFARMGIKSAESLAKLGDALPGLDIQKFTFAMKQLATSMDLSEEGLSALIASAELYGRKSGDVIGGLNSVAEMQPYFVKLKTTFGMSSREATDFVKSIYQLGTAFSTVGFQGGLDLSRGIADVITMTGEQWEALVAGAQSEMPGLVKVLGMTGNLTDQIFLSMRKGPASFMKEVVAKFSKLSGPELDDALRFFSKHMATVFDPKTMDQLRAILKDERQRVKFDAALTGTEIKTAAADTLKKYAEGRRSTLTAQEAYEKAHEAFRTRLANLGSFNSWGFVRNAQQSFKDFGDLLAHIKRQGGVGKELVTMVGDIQRIGAAGLFPKSMQAEMVVFGDVAESVLEPLRLLKQAGLDLISPMGLAAGTVGFLFARFMSHYSKTKNANKAFIQVEKEVLKFITVTLPDKVRLGVKFLADAARAFLNGGFSNLTPDQKTMRDLGVQIVDGIVEGLKATGNFLKGVLNGFMDGLMKEPINTSENSQAIGGALGSMLRSAVDWVMVTVPPIIKDFWAGLTGQVVNTTSEDGTAEQGIANKLGYWLHGALVYVWEWVKSFATALWAGLNYELSVPQAGESEVAVNLGNQIGQWLRQAFDWAVENIKAYLTQWWTTVGEIWDDDSLTLGEKVEEIFGESFPLMIAAVLLAPGLTGTLISTFLSLFTSVFSGLVSSLFSLGSEFLGPVFRSLGSSFARWLTTAALPALGAGFRTIMTSIGSFLSNTLWPLIVNAGRMILTGIGSILTAPVALIVGAIVAAFAVMYFKLKEKNDNFMDVLKRMWIDIKFGFMIMWDAVASAASKVWITIKGNVERAGIHLEGAWETIVDGIADMISGLADTVKTAFWGAVKMLASPLSFIMRKVGEALEMAASTAASMPFVDENTGWVRSLKSKAAELKGVTPESLTREAETAQARITSAQATKAKNRAEKDKARERRLRDSEKREAQAAQDASMRTAEFMRQRDAAHEGVTKGAEARVKAERKKLKEAEEAQRKGLKPFDDKELPVLKPSAAQAAPARAGKTAPTAVAGTADIAAQMALFKRKKPADFASLPPKERRWANALIESAQKGQTDRFRANYDLLVKAQAQRAATTAKAKIAVRDAKPSGAAAPAVAAEAVPAVSTRPAATATPQPVSAQAPAPVQETRIVTEEAIASLERVTNNPAWASQLPARHADLLKKLDAVIAALNTRSGASSVRVP